MCHQQIGVQYTFPTTQYVSDLDFDLSGALKAKCDGAIGLLLYDFLLAFNRNIWHNTATLQDIISNLRVLDTYLSRSLKVNCADDI